MRQPSREQLLALVLASVLCLVSISAVPLPSPAGNQELDVLQIPLANGKVSAGGSLHLNSPFDHVRMLRLGGAQNPLVGVANSSTETSFYFWLLACIGICIGQMRVLGSLGPPN